METHIRSSPVEEERMKRRASSSEEWTASKKRALSSPSGSPVAANGAVDSTHRPKPENDYAANELEKEDQLERFRKAAIFRRMRHYQREYARAHERIQQLESSLRLANLERIQAESCWSNTVGMIRNLYQPELSIWGESIDVETVFPSRIFSSEDFHKSRKTSEAKVQAAEKVVNVFIKFAGKVDRPKYEELLSECRNLQRSNSFLTAEAEQTYILLEETQTERDRYLAELRDAQVKIDRLESRVLRPELQREPEPDVKLKLNGNIKTEAEAAIAGEDTSSAEIPSAPVFNSSQIDAEELEARLQIKDDRITQLEKENASVREQLMVIKSEIEILGENRIMKTPTYRALLQHASKTEALLSKEKRRVTNASEEVTKLRQIQESFRVELQPDNAKEISELKLLLKKRDDDLNRIRQHREQLETQYKEMKALQDNRRVSLTKYKELADSRGERIELLTSEIKRLRSRLAAAAGDEDLLGFLQNDSNIDRNYVEDIKKRLNSSEKELDGLRATLQSNNRSLLDASQLQAKLLNAEQQLEKYKAIAEGELAEQLRAKDEELRVMKIKESQSAQEMNELFSEMDRLSKAWETADKQAQAQTASLEKWEEEKEKLLLAKQKSDHKYFKAMNESEARDGERKQVIRYSEKQAKRIEALENTEKAVLALNDSLTKEVSTLKHELSTIKNTVEYKERLATRYEQLHDEESQRVLKLREEMKKHENDVAEQNITIVKLRDELCKATKEAERTAQRAKSLSKPSGTASERERELEKEMNGYSKLLKCSTCQNQLRSTVITKCMHTFCKSCVDARISHRQRKCPYCNMAFAQSEVQQLYFQ